MIGRVVTSREIPAGATIEFHEQGNALVIYDATTEQVFVFATPFVAPTIKPEKKIERVLHALGLK